MVLKLYVYQLVDNLSRFSGFENWTVLLKRSVVVPHVDPTLLNNMLACLQVLKKLVCPVEEIGCGPMCGSFSFSGSENWSVLLKRSVVIPCVVLF